MLTLSPHAKINLSLEVLGKRRDGYHELVSVMQTVTLSDELRVEDAPDIELTCRHAEISGADNLVFLAARLTRQRFGVVRGARLELLKTIPVAAGLGGGSSDGASALVALDRVWGLRAGCRALSDIAEQLGSDVPFFLYGGTALVEGRGERVARLPDSTRSWYLLACPSVRVSTARIFSSLPPSAWTDGSTTRRLAADPTRTRQPAVGVNALQETLFRVFPETRSCFDAVHRLAPGRALVSGSGPTVFAAFSTCEEALAARRALAGQPLWTAVAASHHPEPGELPCA